MVTDDTTERNIFAFYDFSVTECNFEFLPIRVHINQSFDRKRMQK